MLKQLLLNIDVRLGEYIPVHHLSLSTSPLGAGGKGAWTPQEWGEARKKGYDEFVGSTFQSQQEAQGAFLHRAFGLERRKIESAWRLVDWLKTQRVSSILELGCGEMIASWPIQSSFPSIRYVASDFDPITIERASQVPALNGIEKQVVDAHTLSEETIAQFDLLVAWDVLYAFTPEQMKHLLSKLAGTKTRLMMCSGQIVGPLRGLGYLIKSAVFDYPGKLAKGFYRDHGFKCSVKHYNTLAQSAGMRCRLVETPPVDFRHSDCYNFLLFEK